jgi:hypothetical protein
LPRKTTMTAENVGIKGDTRELVMIFGVIAVPEDGLQGEYQYPVVGTSGVESLSLTIMRLLGNNVEEITKSASPGGLLTSPIWKV